MVATATTTTRRRPTTRSPTRRRDTLSVRDLLRDLPDLLAIDSVGGTPGEADAQHWVADTLLVLGLGGRRVDRRPHGAR